MSQDIGTAGPAPPAYESTDDAYTAGDVTPLSAKCPAMSPTVAVTDYQAVHKGDLIVEIDPPTIALSLCRPRPISPRPRRTLANLANQKDVQRALIRQAEATIEATQADQRRYDLEAKRQRDLLQTRIAGTEATGRAGGRQRTRAPTRNWN